MDLQPSSSKTIDIKPTTIISSEYFEVGTIADLEPHGQFSKWVQDHDILVYRLNGKVQAMSNICRHFGGPIGFHKMKNDTFTCLWHNFQFCAKDGTCKTNPKLSARMYETKINADKILVKLVDKNEGH